MSIEKIYIQGYDKYQREIHTLRERKELNCTNEVIKLLVNGRNLKFCLRTTLDVESLYKTEFFQAYKSYKNKIFLRRNWKKIVNFSLRGTIRLIGLFKFGIRQMLLKLLIFHKVRELSVYNVFRDIVNKLSRESNMVKTPFKPNRSKSKLSTKLFFINVYYHQPKYCIPKTLFT